MPGTGTVAPESLSRRSTGATPLLAKAPVMRYNSARESWKGGCDLGMNGKRSTPHRSLAALRQGGPRTSSSWRQATPFILLALTLLLSACAPWVETAQDRNTNIPVGEIYGSHTVGQTFVARWGGLSGVDVFLATYARENSQPIIFHLRESPDRSDDLATVMVSASDVADNAYQTFSFAPQTKSTDRRYYVLLESPTSRLGDAVTAWLGPADGFVDGALHVAGEPADGQLVFRLRYDPLRLAASLFGEVARAIPFGIALVALLLLPGLAAFVWLQSEDGAGVMARLITAPALSVALLPLLLLWAWVLRVRVNALVVGGFLALAGAAILVHASRRRQQNRAAQRLRFRLSPADLTLGLVFVLILITRWLAVRGLDVPLWGDSYQHTMVAQLLVERGGLFQSWEPYVPILSLTYHFGFHSLAAAIHWITGQELTTATIVAGQALNVLAVLGLYPLAVHLTGSRWAGIGAALVAGLLSPMPQYYVNWGRYTQLAGQAVLPAAILLTVRAVEGRGRREIMLAGLVATGLGLTHYRVFLFYICFLLAWLPFHLLAGDGALARGRQTFGRLIPIGALAFGLALPWLVNLLSSRLTAIYGRMAAGRATAFLRTGYNDIGDIHPYLPAGLIALMLLAGLWAMVRRHQGMMVVIVWTILLLLLANPSLIGVPGAGVVNNFAVFIALYMPAGLLVGYLAGEVLESAHRWRQPAGYVAVAALLAVGLFGGRTQVTARDARFQMVTRPDLEAMDWIRQNTAPDSRFLVNGFLAYGDSVVVGSDAGWWTPLLAGRANTIPPLLYNSETLQRPEFRRELLDFYNRLSHADFGASDTATWLREEGVTHVYVGQRRGQIGFGETDPLPLADLVTSPFFRAVYHHDLVWVFALAK